MSEFLDLRLRYTGKKVPRKPETMSILTFMRMQIPLLGLGRRNDTILFNKSELWQMTVLLGRCRYVKLGQTKTDMFYIP